jgi:hypothetical protein
MNRGGFALERALMVGEAPHLTGFGNLSEAVED